MAQKINLNPSIVKIIIMVTIAIAVGANIGIFFLGKSLIAENAKGISEVATQLKQVQQEIEEIESIRGQMKDLKDIPELVKQSLVNTKDNRHQEKIISILKRYSEMAGLTISIIDFPVTKNSDNKKPIAVVSFQSPIQYTKLLKFIKLTEAGNPRMQVIDLSVSKAFGDGSKEKKGTPDDVSISPIQIQLFSK